MLRGLKSAGLRVSVLLLAGAAQADPVSVVSRVDPALISDTATGQSNAIFPATSAPSISSDGRYVAFVSTAANLIPGLVDANGINGDVYLYDRVAGTITLVSHAATSLTTTGNASASDAVISADGQYVAFSSASTNLVTGQTDTNSARDVFVWTRATGANVLVSRSATSATTTGNGESTFPVISGNGSTVAFNSSATNLITGLTDSNSASDVFFWDRATGNRFCLSRSSSVTSTANGASNVPSISSDGQWIAFQTRATNLNAGMSDTNGGTDVYLYSRAANSRFLVSGRQTATNITGNGRSDTPMVSADGNWVAFRSLASDIAGTDVSGLDDIYLYQRSNGERTLVSRTAAGTSVGVSSTHGFNISADAAYVAYTSATANIVAGQTDTNGKDDVFLFTRSNGATVLVSRAGSATTAGNDSSVSPKVSGDGRYVAFTSTSTNLVAGQTDANADSDVFVFDRISGTLHLASHVAASATTAGDGRASNPGISADGAFVAFDGTTSNLVSGVIDSNGRDDVFLHDRAAGTAGTNAVVSLGAFDSITPAGTSTHSTFPLASVSDDGRWIAFTSDGAGFNARLDRNGKDDIFLRDRLTGVTIPVSGSANDWSRTPVVSADGRYVAYVSAATNLVAGQVDPLDNPFNFLGDTDVFLFDRVTGTTTLVSRAAASPVQAANGVSSAPVISADGRYVAFVSGATDLVAGQTDTNLDTDVFLWDRDTGLVTLVSRTAASATTAGNDDARGPVMSADGRWIAFLSNATNVVAGQSDNSATDDLFLFDRNAGTNRLVSRVNGSATQTSGRSQDPAITPDGRFLVFACTGSNMVPSMLKFSTETDVFLYDRSNGSMKLVSAQPGSPTFTASRGSFAPKVSADGNWVVFVSNASSDLITSQDDTNATTDVFLRNVAASTTVLVSRQAVNATKAANGESLTPSISADGRWTAFVSTGTTLLSQQTDTAGTRDVFLYDRNSATNKLVSRIEASESTAGNAASERPAISAGGSAIVFDSSASNLVAADFNANRDVFVYESTRFVDVVVTNTNGVSEAVAGTPVSYTITVTNKGPFEVPGVLVKDTFPGAMQDVAWTCSAAGGATCTSAGTGNLSDSVNLPVNGVATFLVIANLFKGSFGTLVNTAEAVLPSGFADTQAADNRVTDSDPLVLRTDLSVALADAPDPAVRAGALSYLVSVHNAGPSLAATDATVKLNLPAGVAFGSAAGSSWTCGHAAGVVTCTTPNPDLGDVPPITVQTVAPAVSATPLSASVTVSSGATDPDPDDNVAGAETSFPETGIQVTADEGLTTTETGGTATFNVALKSAPLAAVTVAVTSGDTGEGTVEPASLTFTPESWSEPRTVTLTGVDDDVDDGDAPYTIELGAAESADPGYAGIDPGDVDLTNEDDDQAGIGVTPASGLETTEAGGTATFRVVLESEPTADVTIGLASGDGTEGTVSPAKLTFTAETWDVPQEVTVTGVDDDLTDGDVAYTIEIAAESADAAYGALDPADVSAVNRDDASEGTFYTLAPCRLLDTRTPEDGPALDSGTPVTLYLRGACGIPDTAKALAVNVTVLEPKAPGRLILYPGGADVPSSSILPFRARVTRANQALLGLSADGTLAILPLLLSPEKEWVHVLLDVTGYFE